MILEICVLVLAQLPVVTPAELVTSEISASDSPTVGEIARVHLVVQNPKAAMLSVALDHGWCRCSGPAASTRFEVQPGESNSFEFPVVLEQGLQEFEAQLSLNWAGESQSYPVASSTSIEVANPYFVSERRQHAEGLVWRIWRQDEQPHGELSWSGIHGDAVAPWIDQVDEGGVVRLGLRFDPEIVGRRALPFTPRVLVHGATIGYLPNAKHDSSRRPVRVERQRQGFAIFVRKSDAVGDFRWVTNQPGMLIETYSDDPEERKFRFVPSTSVNQAVAGSLFFLGQREGVSFSLSETVRH